jgi:hypothetical protein
MTQSASTHLMLYMSAQNELTGKADENIKAIETCLNLENISTYILLDKVSKPDANARHQRSTSQYKLPPGTNKAQFKSQGFAVADKEVTDPKVFERMLGVARSHFETAEDKPDPMQKILIFWGHGGGMVMLDEQQAEGVKRARANMKVFADVLAKKSVGDNAISFDIIAFDSCYMCMIETMFELKSVSKFALCSSTMVDADGFPYDKIYRELIDKGRSMGPRIAATRITEVYDSHYLESFPNGDRFLFVCDMTKISTCMEELNGLGSILSDLLSAHDDDLVRVAVREALIGAGVDSSYVYVLRFLKLLNLTLEGRITTAQLSKVGTQSNKLRAAIAQGFTGNMGDSTDVPVSPLIWVPFQLNSFNAHKASYNALTGSEQGAGGWATFWRKFHTQGSIPEFDPEDEDKGTLGLPTTKQLAL